MLKRITITVNERDVKEVQNFALQTTRPTYDVKNAIELLELVRHHYGIYDSREAIFFIRTLLASQVPLATKNILVEEVETGVVTTNETINHKKLLQSSR